MGKQEGILRRISYWTGSSYLKYLLLRHVQWRWFYAAQTFHFHPSVREEVFSRLQDALISAMVNSASLPPNLHVPFFGHLEDGGLGFVRWSKVSEDILYANWNNANSHLAGFELSKVSTPPSAPVSFMWREEKKIGDLHWLSCWPSHASRRFTDWEFSIFLFLMARSAPRLEGSCRLSGQKLQEFDAAQRFEHVTSCLSCGWIINHLRHEFCQDAVVRSLKAHCVTVERLPSDLPRPGHGKGGPDAVIYAGGEGFAVDFGVTKNKVGSVFTYKSRLYEDFEADTGMKVLPFAVSIFGNVDRRTVSMIKEVESKSNLSWSLSRDGGLVRDVLVNGIFSMFKGVAAGFSRLQARFRLEVGSIPDDSEDEG